MPYGPRKIWMVSAQMEGNWAGLCTPGVRSATRSAAISMLCNFFSSYPLVSALITIASR